MTFQRSPYGIDDGLPRRRQFQPDGAPIVEVALPRKVSGPLKTVKHARDRLRLLREVVGDEMRLSPRERIDGKECDRLNEGDVVVLSEALVQFREAARLAPGNDVVRLNVANALQDVGEVAEAIVEYQATLALNPVSADAHNGLGTALAALGRFADAEQQFREALTLRPDHADAQRNLNQLLPLLRR